jgi:hypothetical protein
MEDEWMKKIPSETVCNFFYVFFVIYAVLFALSILAIVGIIVSMKITPVSVALVANGFISSLIGVTMMLFFYLICDRALLTKKRAY